MPTSYNRATLSTFFQTGDVPQGSDYENMIYSQVNIVDTSAQAMAGSLQSPELIASRISAGNVNVTGTLTIAGQFSAANLSVDNLTVASVVTAGAISVLGNINVSGAVVAALLSTGNLAVTGTTSAGATWIAGNLIRPVVTIAASGTTLGAANLLIGQTTRLTSVSDGTNTGVGLQANLTGQIQYLYNETTVSANLWPCTGGQINVLASGAAFPLAGSTLYTIVHTKASGYAVK